MTKHTGAIFSISAPVGAGKTVAITDLCAGAYSSKCVVYAAPTIALVEQTAAQLVSKGLKPLVIHSSQAKVSSVGFKTPSPTARLIEALRYAPGGSKVVVTHAALLEMLASERFERDQWLPRWTCVIDEETSVVTSHKFRTPEAIGFSAYSEPLNVVDGELKVRDEYVQEMRLLCRGISTDDSWTAPNYSKVIARILAPLYRVYGRLYANHLSAISVIDPAALMDFKEVVIIAGLFEHTLTSLIWEHTFGLDIRPFPHISADSLHHNPHLQGHRMTIRYLMPRGIEASGTKLSYGKVAAEIGAVVAAHWPGVPFIFACNETLRNSDGQKIPNPMALPLEANPLAVRVPTVCHGRNDYQEHTRVAALAVTQPDTAMVQKVASLAGTTAEDVRGFFRLHTVYQTVGRTSIRVKGTTDPIEVIVLDYSAAKALSRIFLGAVVIEGTLGDVEVPIGGHDLVKTRPEGFTPVQWGSERQWLKRNEESGVTNFLPPKAQARFDATYPHYLAGREQSEALRKSRNAANLADNNDNEAA